MPDGGDAPVTGGGNVRSPHMPRNIPPRYLIAIIGLLMLLTGAQLVLATRQQTTASTVRVVAAFGRPADPSSPLVPYGCAFLAVGIICLIGAARTSQRWAATGLIGGVFVSGVFAYITGVGVQSAPPSFVGHAPILVGQLSAHSAKPLYFVPIAYGVATIGLVVTTRLMLHRRNRNGWRR